MVGKDHQLQVPATAHRLPGLFPHGLDPGLQVGVTLVDSADRRVITLVVLPLARSQRPFDLDGYGQGHRDPRSVGLRSGRVVHEWHSSMTISLYP